MNKDEITNIAEVTSEKYSDSVTNEHFLERKEGVFDVKIGDTVIFGTSGKYNPGFHISETYTGVITGVTAGGKYIISTGTKKAIVPLKHIEGIVK